MKTKEEILKDKSGIYQFTNGWTFEDSQNLIKAIHEAMDEYANQFRLSDVSSSLPTYDELLEALKETHNLYIEAVKDKYLTHDITRVMMNDNIFKRLEINKH